NLAPASWAVETRRLENAGQMMARLQLAAMIYLIVVAAAFVYLVVLKKRVQNLDAEIAKTQPQVAFQEAQKAKWAALAAAIDPSRFPVEILNELFADRPSKEIKFTLFDYTPQGFRVDVEAPNGQLFTDYETQVRNDSALATYKIEFSKPKFLPPDLQRVQFTI